MIKENTLANFIADFIEFIKNVKEELKNYLPGILIKYSKNILTVIKNGLILCLVLIFFGLLALSAVGTLLLIPSLISSSYTFHWYFAVSPVVLVLCVAGILTAERDD